MHFTFFKTFTLNLFNNDCIAMIYCIAYYYSAHNKTHYGVIIVSFILVLFFCNALFIAITTFVGLLHALVLLLLQWHRFDY